jgi:hypothetical protein
MRGSGQSIADRQEQPDGRTRVLSEALARQAAITEIEILRIISQSPSDL